MTRRPLLAFVVVIAMLIAAPSAHALVVTERSEVPFEFTGATCGSTSLANVTLPPGAFNVQQVSPVLGQVLPWDVDDVTPVATITATSITDVGGRLVSSWAATGSDNVCTDPAGFPEGWTTNEMDLITTFQRRVQTFFRGTRPPVAQRRPRRINFGPNSFVVGLRWSSWDGAVARGRGRAKVGAGRTLFPVRVRLSRVRFCGSYRYLTMQLTFTRGRPSGVRRTVIARFDFNCR
jgi:hypothetical protein